MRCIGIDMSPLLCTNYKFFTVFHRLYSKTQQWFNSLFLSGYQGILEGLDVISIGVSHPEFLMFQPNMLEHVGNDVTSRGVCYDHRPRALRTPLPGSRHRLDCVWPVGPHSKLNWARELCTSCTQLAQNVSKNSAYMCAIIAKGIGSSSTGKCIRAYQHHRRDCDSIVSI